MHPPAVSSRVVLLVMFVVFGWMVDVPRASEILDRGLRQRTGRFGRRMLRIAGALRMALRRKKRDENESVRSAFGRGVGFYIGEPCESVCNNILFEVYCNKTSGKCECHDRYPVNIENRLCVKAARLGDDCKHDDACAFFDNNAVCPSGTCRCADGFQPSHHIKGAAICLPASTVTFLENSYLMTSISAIAGLVIVTALLCLVLRLFSKARFDRPSDRMASAGSPPTMLSAFTGSHVLESRRPSRSSGASTDYLPASRRASYGMLAPPSSLGSRRPSSSSMRSGLSFRTQSSFRGYRYYSRDPVRRTLSSPAESSQPPSPPCKHHNHPLHHNSPVDDEDIMDVRFTCPNCKCESSKQSHLGNSDNLSNFLTDDDDSSCRENHSPVRGKFYHSKPASHLGRQPQVRNSSAADAEPGVAGRRMRKARTFEERRGNFK